MAASVSVHLPLTTTLGPDIQFAHLLQPIYAKIQRLEEEMKVLSARLSAGSPAPSSASTIAAVAPSSLTSPASSSLTSPASSSQSSSVHSPLVPSVLAPPSQSVVAQDEIKEVLTYELAFQRTGGEE